MNLNKRLNELEAVNNPEKLPNIEIVLVDCVSQTKHPELFNKVPTGHATGKQMYRLEPKDPDFTCNCHCCENKTG
jgi:hypothetical protein